MRLRPLRPLALAAALLAGAALAGCGLGSGGSAGGKGASLTVTRDFGVTSLVTRTVEELPKSETVMRLLDRNATVRKRFGGGFVQCIDALCGEGGTQRQDWFYFVNGVEARKGAASTTVQPGDAIWWDRRDWRATSTVPAVVGSFPEPFLNGPGTAKRLPVRVECIDPGGADCDTVEKALVAEQIPAAKGQIGGSITEETLRVIVGPWERIRGDATLVLLEDGPSASGVYAQLRADGRSIALLDGAGRPTRTLGAGSGLIAATRTGEDPPVWTVTGTDAAGVAAAAKAFGREALRGRYAVAVGPAGPIALPEAAG